MRKLLITFLLLFATTVHAVTVIPMPEPIDWLSRTLTKIYFCRYDLKCYFASPKLGVSLTTIWATTTIASYPTIHNANMNALNDGKIEVGSSSIASILSLPNLANTNATSVGTILLGRWAGNTIQSSVGGTGTTSMSQFRIILGNGTASTTIATSTGTAGQFFTSNGEGLSPSWQTSAVDTSIAYTWTAQHTFSTSTATRFLSVNATTTNLGVSGTLNLNGLNYQFPAIRGASSTVLTEDGTGKLAFQLPGFVLLVSSSTPVATSTMLFDNLAASTYLKIVINIPSITGGRPTLIFNGDVAANYGFKLTSENGTTYSPSAAQSYLEIQPDINGTTTPQIFVVLEGSNRAANRKVFNITGNTQLSGTQPPLPFRGGGVWNNTATQISSISLNNSSGINNNFAAGTFVRIYGSND